MTDRRRIIFTNNAKATLVVGITADDTELEIDAGFGDLFPDPDYEEIFKITLENPLTGDIEIMNCVGRIGDVLEVERGVEETTAIEWAAGSIVSHRATAETLRQFAPRRVPVKTAGVGNTNYTLTLEDAESCVEMINSTAKEVIIPSDDSVLFADGTTILVRQQAAGSVTISNTGFSSVSILKPASFNAVTAEQYSLVCLHKRAANSWVLSGQLDLV